MRAPKVKKELYEGLVLIEVVDEFGDTRLDVKEENKLGKPAKYCGECCHGDEAPESYVVIGKIVDGKIDGKPLRKWLPYVVD